MKLLLFGRSGQVATAIRRRACGALVVEAVGREGADLEDPEACARLVAHTDADAVVNAAAYTNVDMAETETSRAMVVNGDAPVAIARAAARRNLPFLHLSTDYVFDGSGESPWMPDATPSPINVYGRSKRFGEEGVLAAGGRGVILRTSWVFSAWGRNFVTAMLRLGRERTRASVVADQVGGPTGADDIAVALVTMAERLSRGVRSDLIYHYAGAPEVSRADFARAVFDLAGLAVTVEDVASSDFPTPARRPLNSRLDCASILGHHGIVRPDWRQALRATLAEMAGAIDDGA